MDSFLDLILVLFLDSILDLILDFDFGFGFDFGWNYGVRIWFGFEQKWNQKLDSEMVMGVGVVIFSALIIALMFTQIRWNF